MPSKAIFGKDMLSNKKPSGEHRQMLVDQNNVQDNKNQTDFDYTIGQQVIIIKDGILHKSESRHEGPYVHCYGTVRIQRRNISK